MNSDGDTTRPGEMPDAQLDQLLEAASGELLGYVRSIADPGLPLLAKPEPDILALLDELFDALVEGHPDRKVLGFLWRDVDTEGRLRPLEYRMRIVLDWINDHSAGQAQGVRDTG